MTARRGRALVALAFVLSTVLLTACGSSSSSTGSTATTTYPPLRPPTTTTTHQQPAPAGPPVGRTQRVDAPGTVLSVTISRVIDPLGGSGASLPPGTRAIGVEAVIADDGPGVYDSSSTGDFSVLTSKGVAPPVYAASGVCQTPLRDWDNEISPGETRNGCIAYSVPAHANVLEVRFSPHALAHGRVAWAVH